MEVPSLKARIERTVDQFLFNFEVETVVTHPEMAAIVRREGPLEIHPARFDELEQHLECSCCTMTLSL